MAMAMNVQARAVPREFIWRRVHSLTGFWFLLFLIEHLFTNSQAALFFGDDGFWFVRSVNFLRNLPYLHVIEIVLLGVPILLHMVLGIFYIFTAKSNCIHSDGSSPLLKYGRNRAYTYQRWSSWIIAIGLVLHVVQMRFLDYPAEVKLGGKPFFYTKLHVDPGLYPVADRLGVRLYDSKAILREKEKLSKLEHKAAIVGDRLKEVKQEEIETPTPGVYNSELDNIYQSLQTYQAQRDHIRGLESRNLQTAGDVMVVSPNFGDILLLSVRQTFQSVPMCILYTIFVIAAVYHGFNGLWTMLITWGVMLSKRSQERMVPFCIGLMFVIGFLGMVSIWGTYFINLKT